MLTCAALLPPKDYDVFSRRFITDEQLGQLIIRCHLTLLDHKENIQNGRLRVKIVGEKLSRRRIYEDADTR